MKQETIEFNTFASKAHFFNFRKAWADSCNKYDYTLSASHYLLYNVLRGKHPLSGFSPITRPTKLAMPQHPHEAFRHAVHIINAYASRTSTPDKTIWRGDTYAEIIDRFLLPFGGNVTYEMLVDASVKLNAFVKAEIE